MLGPQAENVSVATKSPKKIALLSVSVPDVVDRSQLVVYRDSSRVEILEHERWAEPLKAAIASAIARDLRAQSPDAQVAVYPQVAVTDAACRLSVDVQRLELRRKDSATVEALWTLRCGDGPLAHGSFYRREPVTEDSYEALTAGLSRALSQIAKDIAAEIGKLPAAKS